MNLWTVQPIEVWGILQKKGLFTCNPSKGKNPEFRRAYDWLKSQMAKRIAPISETNIDPIWAWARYNYETSPTVASWSNTCMYEKNSVLIEFEKPDSEVLLSDFNAWHFVLNNSYLDTSTTKEEWEKQVAEFESHTFDEQDIIKKESWERVFDVSPLDTGWVCRGRYVQATFWKLALTDVRKITFL